MLLVRQALLKTDLFQSLNQLWSAFLFLTALHCLNLWSFSFASPAKWNIPWAKISAHILINIYIHVYGTLISVQFLYNIYIIQARLLELWFWYQMTSVERILKYTKLEQEEVDGNDCDKPPDNWPSNCAMEFQNVTLRYYPEAPAALKAVNFSIHHGEKVGVPLNQIHLWWVT